MDEFEVFDVKPFVSRLLGEQLLFSTIDYFMLALFFMGHFTLWLSAKYLWMFQFCFPCIATRHGWLVWIHGQNSRSCTYGPTARAFTEAFGRKLHLEDNVWAISKHTQNGSHWPGCFVNYLVSPWFLWSLIRLGYIIVIQETYSFWIAVNAWQLCKFSLKLVVEAQTINFLCRFFQCFQDLVKS